MKPPTVVTVGGLPGTGTSTLCRLLERDLGLPWVYAGAIFREEAARRGMSLAELNELAQHDDTVDRTLDERQLELIRGGGVVMEGRMAGWLAKHHGVAALTVWVVCDEDERVRRLVERDGGDPGTARRDMRIRVAREKDRYQRYYGADIENPASYDMVLDSTSARAEALASLVEARILEGPAPTRGDPT